MFRRMSVFLIVTVLAAGGYAMNVTTAEAAGSGNFSVLTYNVSGLPELINSASTPRGPSTTVIGGRLRSYDIVNVQEDFNYHRDLYSADSHPYRTSTSGGAGIGSGLNTLSNYPYADFERVKWNSCNSSDCMTPKGFTLMRVSLANGASVDFYNLHANAGTGSGDLKSRAANLGQLTGYIKSHSSGNAVVVMGDTNTRYTRVGDTIAGFAADNGLTDAWVELQRNGNPPAGGDPTLLCDEKAISNDCEVVDKVLYRSSPAVTLRATKYNNEHAAFLDSSGAMLSDHDPIAVQFGWTQN
jgi:endonuclease/exonuclease/phosphatase family metal-dependent hydrolase